MDIPSTSSNSSLFSLQTARDLLTGLQAQDPSSGTSVEFNQVLAASPSVTDTVEIGSAALTTLPDPTASALFQAHAGAQSASQALAANTDAVLLSDRLSQLRVTGIEASSAAGSFANGQSLQAETFQAELNGLGSSLPSRYPAAAGASDFSSTYDAMRSTGRMNPPVGIRLDVEG